MHVGAGLTSPTVIANKPSIYILTYIKVCRCAVIARTTTAAHYKRHKAQEISKSPVSTKGIEI
jgi:hypothetical protein